MIENIFEPIFKVTLDPESDPKLSKFLLSVVGIDSVDDESAYEKTPSEDDIRILPKDYTSEENPNYCYYLYYFWANIRTLNELRSLRRLNTYQFRPHCGEAGSIEHLMAAYLVADSINHGIVLVQNPVIYYLYYLRQVGLSVSPLSNHKLFLKYKDSPFREYLEVGLNVTLSTDDPLIFHLTDQSLLEEYSLATQVKFYEK